jgi:hypothetical protein
MTTSIDASNFDPAASWNPEPEPDAATALADKAAGKSIDAPPPPILDNWGTSSSAPTGGLDTLRLLGDSTTVTVGAGVSGPAQAPVDEDIGPGLREEPASRDLWSGANYREHAGAEVDTRGGDIRLEHGQQVNLRGADGSVSVSSDTTHAANVHTGNTRYETSERVSVETPDTSDASEVQYSESHTNDGTAPIADTQRSDSGGIKPDFNIVNPKASAEVSVASASASGDNGSIKASVLGAEAKGAAAAGFGPGTVRAEASGSASVYAAKVEAEVHAGPLSAAGEVAVGAEVEGAAEAEFDPAQGDVGVSAEASAFAGARAEGEAKAELGAAEASAKGDVGVGIGGEVKAELGFEDGTFSVDLGAHGYLGVGGGGEVSFEVDVPELAGDVADFGQGAIDVGADVIGNVGEFGGNAVAGVAQAWDSFTPW